MPAEQHRERFAVATARRSNQDSIVPVITTSSGQNATYRSQRAVSASELVRTRSTRFDRRLDGPSAGNVMRSGSA